MEEVQVNAGDLLLYLGLISCCLSAAFMFTGRRWHGIMLARLAAALVTLCVMLLAYAFITLDFSNFYVWQHDSEQMSVLYRIAAMLVGQEGTYLVWAWLSLSAVLIHIERYRGDVFMHGYALLFCAFLLILTITMTPFRSIFSMEGAALPSSGNGIHPSLLDILMPLHIFAVFAAYAFTIVPAASSLAYLIHGKMPSFRNHLRLSWLFLSAGMIAGGIWANRLLGWSGFWQWDPVQSSIMATWLLLTAALHAYVRFGKGEYRRLFPLLCIGTFLSTIYTTFIARSGIYSSIHSFPGSPTWWMLVVFMGTLIISSLCFVFMMKIPETSGFGGLKAAFAPHNTFYSTIALLIAMAFIALWGPTVYVVLFYFGKKTIMNTQFYNVFMYPLVMGISYLVGACMIYGRVRNQTIARVGMIYFAVSFILGILLPYSAHSLATSDAYTGSLEMMMGSISVLSYLPAFFFVTGNIIFKAMRDYDLKNGIASTHLTGINLLHLGIVLVILAAAVSTSFGTEHYFSFGLSEKGVYKENNGISMKLLDFRIEQEGNDWVQIVDVEVERQNMTTVFRKSRQFGFVASSAVQYGLFSDIKVDFEGLLPHQLQQGRIMLIVKRQPLAGFIWLGGVILVIGALCTMISNLLGREKTG